MRAVCAAVRVCGIRSKTIYSAGHSAAAAAAVTYCGAEGGGHASV